MFKKTYLRKSASASDTSSSSGKETKNIDVSLQADGAPHALTDMMLRRKAPSAAQWAAAGVFYASPALYRVVSPIAHAMASLDVWTESKDGKMLGDQPFDLLMGDPNDYMSSYQFRHLQAVYEIIEGESLAWLIPDSSKPSGYQMLPLPPHECTLVQGEGTEDEMEWEVTLNSRRTRIPFDQVVWTKTSNPAAPYDRGIGIGSLVADEIQIDEYAAEHIKNTLYNRAVPDQVVHVRGANEDRLKALEKEWKNKFGGPNKRGLPLFSGSDGDDLVVKRLNEKFSDLGLTDLRRFAMETVRKALNVSPEIIGENENSNRATSQTAQTHFATYVVNPRMVQATSEWETHLLPMLGTPNQMVGYESPIPEDRDFQLEVAQAFSDKIPPHMTVNEARALQGLPEREDGDVYMRDPFLAPIPAKQTKNQGPVYEVDLDYLEKGLRYDGITKITDADLRVAHEELTFDPNKEALIDLLTAKALDFATQQMIMLGEDSPADALEAIRPGITEHFRQVTAEKIEGIFDTSKQIVKDEVQNGFEQGLSNAEIARNLDEKMATTNRNRARLIARTEGVQAASVGKHNAIQNSDVVQWKRWIATVDGDTRDDHERLNGQTVPKDQTFNVGNWSPRYPGDGPIEQVANCRCAVQGVVDPNKGLSDQEVKKAWELHDKALNEAEKDIMAFFEDALEQSRKDLMQKLGN